MKDFQYINGCVSLKLDKEKCIGCGICLEVCPHQIFLIQEGKAVIREIDRCMECGACSKNCPVQALQVTPGVGCAAYIIAGWISKLSGRNISTHCC